MKKALIKEFWMEVRKSKARFLSILFIVTLGVAFFSGIQAASPDMRFSGDDYYDAQELMDLKVIGSLGLTEDDVQALSEVEGITYAEGGWAEDVLCGDGDSLKVIHIEAISENFNKLTISDGRLPQKSGECFLDESFAQGNHLKTGDTISVREDGDRELLLVKQYTVVGIGQSPLYISFNRGNTTLGSGEINGFAYILPEDFEQEIYTQIYLRVHGAQQVISYTDAYEELIEHVQKRIEAIEEERCLFRLASVREDANQELQDGIAEYQDARIEAEEELSDAKSELTDGEEAYLNGLRSFRDGERQLESGKKQLQNAREQLEDGKKQLEDGQTELEKGKQDLIKGKSELSDAREELQQGYQTLEDSQAEVDTGWEAIQTAEAELNSGKEELEKGRADIQDGKDQLEAGKTQLEEGKKQLEEGKTQLEEGKTQLESGKAQLEEGKTQLEAGKTQLEEGKKQLEEGKTQLEEGKAQLEEGKTQLEAGKQDLENGKTELEAGKTELEEGKTQLAVAEKTLTEKQEELESGKKELESAKTQLAEGQLQLETAKTELETSKEQIEAGMQELETAESQLAQGLLDADAAGTVLSEQREQLEAAKENVLITDEEYDAQNAVLSAAETELSTKYEELSSAQILLAAQRTELEASFEMVTGGLEELEKQVSALNEKEAELAAAEETLNAGEEELAAGWITLGEKKSELETAEKKIQESEAALKSAEETIQASEKEIAENEEKLKASEKEIEESEKTILENEQTLIQSEKEIVENEKTLKESEKEIKNSEKEIKKSEKQLQKSEKVLLSSEEEIAKAEEEIQKGEAELQKGEEEIASHKTQLEEAEGQIQDGWQELQAGEDKLRSGETVLADGEAEIAENEQKLIDAVKEIEENEKKLQDSEETLRENEEKLEDARAEIEDGYRNLREGWREFEKGKREAYGKLSEAEEEIAEGKEDILSIELPEWYITGRNDLPEYSDYGDNAERIRNLGKVFPVIFFLVAALISLTTMTRMVEDQRTQIGTLKALGYGMMDIASKYICYAFLATLGGSILGVLIGEKVIPWVIIKGYSIMYHNVGTHMSIHYEWKYALLAAGAALFCTVGATVFSCYRELSETPASLMRPPAPKEGKRIFLEYITFLWKHMNFTWKSSMRNLFRYKKRLFMTIFGIAGSMGLMLVGFGLHDSIMDVALIQYAELQHYDGTIILDEEASQKEVSELMDFLEHHEHVLRYTNIMLSKMSATNGHTNLSTYVYVPQNLENFKEDVTLKDRVTDVLYEMPEDGAAICEKTASLLGLSVGDDLVLQRDNKNYRIPVSVITENYMGHYVYMTPALYEKTFAEKPDYQSAVFTVTEDAENAVEAVGEDILSCDAALSISYTASLAGQIDRMLTTLNMVVVVLIVSAGMLAFVVLYNLNNINITERQRELATLKVLGFYDGEVSSYVFRENIVLTIFGIAVGVLFGIALHRYTITTVEVDAVMFGRNIQPISFIYCAVLTTGFSMIVNLFMHSKLKKIDMVESLKSVE